MSSVGDVTTTGTTALDARLLTLARGLVVVMPVCYLIGRVPTDIALSLVALLFVGHSLLLRDWLWTRRGWFRIAMVLWLWMLFVSNFAVSPALSFQQSLFWWRFLVFAAALEWWVMDEACMRRVLVVATAVSAAVALDAWLQYFTGTDLLGHPRAGPERLTGPFDDPRVGSWIQRLLFPVVMGAFAWRLWAHSPRAAGVALVALLVLLVGAVVMSGERMATGLTLLGLMLGGWLQRGLLRRMVLAGLAVTVVGLVALAVSNHNIVDRYVDQTANTLASISKSPYGEIWRSALHVIAQRPVIGVGLKNFRVACDEPGLALPASIANRCTTHPHNLYLEWLVGAGAVGLALFICLVTAWVRRLAPPAWRGTASPWLYGPAIMVFTILWPVGPSGSFFSNWYGGVFYLSLGWALAAVRLSETGAPSSPSAGRRGQEARLS